MKHEIRAEWSAEVEIQVQFFDLDPMEIVWHGRYVQYLETARCALLDRIDYNYPQMKASGYAWPVIDLHLRYAAPATFGQRIKVRAAIVEWENRLKIDYLISDAVSGKRLTRASTVQVAVGLEDREMRFASPPVLLEKLGLASGLATGLARRASGKIRAVATRSALAAMLFAAAVAGLVVDAHAATTAPIAQIQSVLAKPDSMCGRFDQAKQLVGIKKPLLSSGRFCVVAGKGVLWRTLQPFASTLRLTPDEIVQMQGDRVAMRLDAKQEPVVKMINSVLFSLLAGDLGQLDQVFIIEGSLDSKSRLWKVALQARQPALAKAIGAIDLEGGEYVRKVVMNEAGGDHTEILFSDIRTGASSLTPEETAAFASAGAR